jgi:5-methylcytosine-specific restriction protein A
VSWDTSRHPGSTRRQRKQRADILARDPACYLNYDGCTHTSTVEDHVIPLSQGGDRWAYSNRRGACTHCHNIKTQQEAQAARVSPKRPVPKHPGLR